MADIRWQDWNPGTRALMYGLDEGHPSAMHDGPEEVVDDWLGTCDPGEDGVDQFRVRVFDSSLGALARPTPTGEGIIYDSDYWSGLCGFDD